MVRCWNSVSGRPDHFSARGQGDAITALNAAQQQLQRDMAGDRVKLGLVEQSAIAHARFIEQAQGFDAIMARLDERLKAQERLDQFLRDLAGRRPPSLTELPKL